MLPFSLRFNAAILILAFVSSECGFLFTPSFLSLCFSRVSLDGEIPLFHAGLPK